jgi:hypothetical protein
MDGKGDAAVVPSQVARMGPDDEQFGEPFHLDIKEHREQDQEIL